MACRSGCIKNIIFIGSEALETSNPASLMRLESFEVAAAGTNASKGPGAKHLKWFKEYSKNI